MNLDDVLSKNKSQVSPLHDLTTLFLSGAIEPDSAEQYFRLYRNPNSRRSYFLIRRDNIVGSLHEWTDQESANVGVVGSKMYRVPLKYGSEILAVSVVPEKLGETIAGDSIASDLKPGLSGICKPASGCGSKPCCTTTGDGRCRCDHCCVS